MSLAPLLALTLLAGPHRTKVAVLDIQAPDELKPKAAMLTPVVVGEFAKRSDLQVISSQEVAGALGLARQRQLLGCAEDACLAEIGGALGVDFLVSSSVGHIGSRYRLDLRLVRASNGGIVGSVGDFIAGSDDDLADATVRLADTLVATLPAPGATGVTRAPNLAPTPAGGLAEPAPPHASHTGAYVAWGAAGALAVGAAVMTAVTVSTFNDVHDHPADPDRLSKADSLGWKGPLADGLWGATLVSAGIGTYLYFSAPSAGAGGEVGVGGSF